MTTPVQTPNTATTTKPERSSKRTARKAPLGWLPWLLLLLLALLIAGIVAALLASRDDNSSSSTRSTTSSASTLGAVAAGALVGGGGAAAADAATASGSATGTREAGTAGTVLFAEGGATLDANAQRVIAQAVTNLRRAGVRSVEVIGYTDVVAGQPVNAPLSQQRADAVAAQLKKSLPGVTVTTSAQGEADPIAPNSTEQGRQQNRRAAIVARG